MVRSCAPAAITSVILLTCYAPALAQTTVEEMLWLSPRYRSQVWSHRAGSLSPEARNAAAEYRLARRAEEQQDSARAIEHYRAAVSAGRQVEHCLSLANLYLKLRELQVAEATTRECGKLDEESIYPTLSLVQILQEQGRFTQAAEQLSALIPSHPTNSFVLYMSGRNYQALNITEPAEA